MQSWNRTVERGVDEAMLATGAEEIDERADAGGETPLATAGRFLGSTPVVLAWYVALTCYTAWHFLPKVASTYNAGPGDGANFLWGWIEVPSRLFHGQDPFHSDRIFYPVGADLSFHAGAPVVGLVVGVLSPVLGLALASNLVNLAGTVLSGWGVHLIARHERANLAGAYLAGTAFALNPNRMQRMGRHHNFFHTELLVFAVWALLRLLDRPTWGRGLTFGVLAGLTYWNESTWGICLFVIVGLLVLARRGWRGQTLRSAGAAAIGLACTGGPLLFAQLFARATEGAGDLEGDGQVVKYSTDLASYITPPDWNTRYGHDVSTRFGTINGGEALAYLGLSVLALAVVGAVATFGRRRGWTLSAVVLLVASLGPVLVVDGWTGSGLTRKGLDYAIPLPFAIVTHLPILNGLRAPGRFVIPAALAVAVLAGLGLTRLCEARVVRARPPLRALAALAVLLAVFELQPPGIIDELPTQAPELYAEIAKDPRPGAVLELPLQWGDGLRGIGSDPSGRFQSELYLWNRQSHDRPIVGGFVSRLSQDRVDRLTKIPLYASILNREGPDPYPDADAITVQNLHDLGIRFVVTHTNRPTAVLPSFEALPLELFADDGVNRAWVVP